MTAIWALTGPSGCAEDRGTTRQGDGDRAAEAPAGASHQSRVMERAKAQPRERSEPCARRSQPGSGAPGFPGGPSSARRSRGRDWRLTTQRSAEDEEEAARERRRRARDRELRAQDEDGGQSPEPPEQESLLSLKPSEAPELDEDEGFSDWSQKPEPQRQPWEAGGASNSGEPPRSESPEGQQEENRPHQHAYGSQGGDEQSPARVSLEELHLSPSSELQDGPGTEETEPKSPEGTVQGSLGPAEAQESDEQHQKRQQPRTPSPLVLEGATEQGSPPLSPSTKLIDRTESLNRSIRKSVKKSQPPLPISKIDERLEQYTQAIETAGRTPKLTRQPSIELPSMAVASTKSRWETGEVQAQSTAKTPSCKDIVAGDMSKKSLWEQKGGSKTSSTIKQSTPSGKRYKFVATGHGKYEKVLVDEGSVP
ncbi:lymphocyte-specific protein 1 isoform X3 [Prionailurus viverrinus]|uniref:lymphocyte-specific protein 1 isoform X3 n=1 Tax=Prionailurus viverrinus TaxID=61388 RepID=UPI001FF6E0CF|nr:lymphocyte-specific protein 1 isoform X3 [Prionailurus viverrinus]